MTKNLTMWTVSTTTPLVTPTALSKDPPRIAQHVISLKDGVVIGFILGLWLYSIILMFRYLKARLSNLPLVQRIFFISGPGRKFLIFQKEKIDCLKLGL